VTVTQTDAAGNPLHAVFAVADLLDGSGAPVVGSGHQQWSWRYDGNERLTGVAAVFTDFGKSFLSMDIAYDDAALRIQYASTVDYAGVTYPAGTPPGENGGFDQFDASLRLIERSYFHPGDQSHYSYRYDDQGRLLTIIGERRSTTSHVQYVENLIYQCP
jgi:YD repeat-containing protein